MVIFLSFSHSFFAILKLAVEAQPTLKPASPAKRGEPKKSVRKTAARKPKKEIAPMEAAAVMKAVLPVEKPDEKRNYIYAVGRRKSAVARVRLFPQGTGSFTVNKKSVEAYFSTFESQKIAREALEKIEAKGIYDVSAYVRGGGVAGQADAVRLGIARALVKFNEDFRKPMRSFGFLTRDPRVKERKKPGLKRARKAPQFSKR